MPVQHFEAFYKDRNVFKLLIPRFNVFAQYEGIYLKLNKTTDSVARTPLYQF